MIQRVAVIGAGPAGITAAIELLRGGIDVTIYESSESVGGMARSFQLWDQIVDVGPHRFFSSDPRVNKFWLDAIGDEYVMVDRLTRIYYKQRFFDYPLKALNALSSLGVAESFKCLGSYIKARLFPIKNESTFEAWVTNRFGNRLYSIFFKSYTEKLWGINCSELDADFAAQRIKKLDLYEAIKAAVFGGGGVKHKTLVDQFAYPKMGAGQVYEKLAEKFVLDGGQLNLGTRVAGINIADGEQTHATVRLENGKESKFDHVISTMPITHLVSSLNPPENIRECASRLKFRNTIIVYLEIDGKSPFPDQWIYVHEPKMRSGRITNFANWTSSINQGQDKTIICLEFWCYDEDDIWGWHDDDLVSLARNEMKMTSLASQGTSNRGYVLRVPKCYPVYGKSYKTNLAPVEKFLSNFCQLSVIGRYGSFKYNNQDHSILMGLLAAENLLHDANNNLWQINTDYEYQESSRITSTGLVGGDK